RRHTRCLSDWSSDVCSSDLFCLADARSYLPGGEAKVHFHVSNQNGKGVSAALGLEVVDQAVFALAEKQPGFAKVFFYLERELMRSEERRVGKGWRLRCTMSQ